MDFILAQSGTLLFIKRLLIIALIAIVFVITSEMHQENISVICYLSYIYIRLAYNKYIVGNLYYIIIMNLGRKKIQKAASTSPWAVLIVPKFASLSASIYYLYYQINLINNLVACIGMMDWYF